MMDVSYSNKIYFEFIFVIKLLKTCCSNRHSVLEVPAYLIHISVFPQKLEPL